jgi:prolyl-tRNA editing enzyme YbaK/EbsC (Cys-tRNA(Pro) deacylase)
MVDTSLYHPVVEKIRQILVANAIEFEMFTHEPVLTSEEASKIRPGYTLHQGTKAMILKIKKRGGGELFSMFVLPADTRIDNKALKMALDLTDVRFATPGEIAEMTGGVEIGGVPPFGNLFDIPVYADPDVFGNERIVFNAGDRRFSIAMTSEAYRRVVRPEMLHFHTA